MEIREIRTGKKDYLSLLLLADEQEDMVDRYLERGTMYVLFDSGARAECVVTDEGGGVLELKNLAVEPASQGMGYGKALIGYLVETYRERYSVLQVGTGESPLTVPFYERCGFVYSHRVRNFFTDNYARPLVECGLRLIDMVYLRRPLRGGAEPAGEPRRSLYLGCLLGGAVGDALGYPVEFLPEREIFRRYGPEGIRTLAQAGAPAVVSDDTQMTMFAANAILRSETTGEDWETCIRTAYLEWLATQEGDPAPRGKPRSWVYELPALHALRAPGNTCLSSLRALSAQTERVFAENGSKGCGTVMRAAPYGLWTPRNAPEADAAGYDARLTHGHPEAARASAVLAAIIRLFTVTCDRSRPMQEMLRGVAQDFGMLEGPVRLALDPSVSDLDGIHRLGEGWTAAEALQIALFCAVRYQNDFGKAVRTAVNHKGDADSTGAICGNLMGAWLGAEKLREAFDLEDLEMREELTALAEDLYRAAVKRDVPAAGADPVWDARYRGR